MTDDIPTTWDEDSSDLAILLDDVEAFIRRFVVFGSKHQSVAVSLWVAHVYAVAAAYSTPYLRIKSAVEASGKSTLLEVLALLLRDRAIDAASTTAAVVFRMRDQVGPVAFLLDEVDQTLRNRQDDGARDLLAIVNAGHRRGKRVMRTVGQSHEPKAFTVFGPAVIAGIGSLHATTESRCIPIRLDRKVPGEGDRLIPGWSGVGPVADELADRLDAWASDDVIDKLRSERPVYPDDGLTDRQLEGWLNLFAIADMAGADWPDRARTAALALHGDADDIDAMSYDVLLLRHIREAFDDEDKLFSTELLFRLVDNAEGVWAQWWGVEVERVREAQANPYRTPSTTGDLAPRAAASQLAKHLRGFGIKPRVVRIGDQTARGYYRQHFIASWSRYLPAVPQPDPLVTDGTDVTPQASPTSDVTSVTPVTGGSDTGEEDMQPVLPLEEGETD